MRRLKGFSLIELLIVVAIILIIAAIAIPNLIRARMNANDSAAAFTMRTINTAQTTYLTNYPKSGYAPDLKTLGPNGLNCFTSPATATSSCLLDDALGCATMPCLKGGYKYWVTSSAGSAPFSDYTASATPLSMNMSGRHNICTNSDAVVRVSPDGATQLSAPVSYNNCADTTQYNGLN